MAEDSTTSATTKAAADEKDAPNADETNAEEDLTTAAAADKKVIGTCGVAHTSCCEQAWPHARSTRLNASHMCFPI